MNQKNCMVAQSGGPTSAINASLAGVIAGVKESGMYDVCYGAINGVLGILNEHYMNLSEKIADEKTLQRLMVTPAMYLGSCRHKLPTYQADEAPYVFIFQLFERLSVKAFFYIGGNDSMDTVLKLSDYAKKIKSDVKIIGIPKTIDNDLCMTDHTPGFGSAAKYIASSILEIAHDTFIYAVKSVTIVEIMGRDAGWLTASSALARNEYNSAPHLIYLPEVSFDRKQFIADVKEQLSRRDNVIIAVSEGIKDANGNYVTVSEESADHFGHRQLSGAGKALELLVKEEIDVKVRSVEVNVLQRCAAHMVSKTDIEEAFSQGKYGVTLAEQGKSGCMVCLKRIFDAPYRTECDCADILAIANEAKMIPRDWINARGNDIMPELLSYLYPLIQGEIAVEYVDGVPAYMNVAHLNRLS